MMTIKTARHSVTKRILSFSVSCIYLTGERNWNILETFLATKFAKVLLFAVKSKIVQLSLGGCGGNFIGTMSTF